MKAASRAFRALCSEKGAEESRAAAETEKAAYAAAAVSSFLASFETLREREGAFNAWRGSTNDQTAPEGARLLCRVLRPTTEIPRVLVLGPVTPPH